MHYTAIEIHQQNINLHLQCDNFAHLQNYDNSTYIIITNRIHIRKQDDLVGNRHQNELNRKKNENWSLKFVQVISGCIFSHRAFVCIFYLNFIIKHFHVMLNDECDNNNTNQEVMACILHLYFMFLL